MADLKHVGRLVTNKKRVVVAFRTLPGDPNSALVIGTESLRDQDHDALIKVVESNAGQTAYELAEALDRASLPETGDSMLTSFHKRGILVKVATTEVEMIPNSSTSIILSDLNRVIADQRGISIEDLTVKPGEAAKVTEVGSVNEIKPPISEPIAEEAGVLTDDDLAKQYRSQADTMFKEAQRLRKEADELSPIKKKSSAKKTA
jgi:hypothetical protein